MELLNECVLLAIAIVFASSVFSITLKSYQNMRKKKLAPIAKGGWPIIGHLHLLGASKLPHTVLATMANNYGPIFRIRLGVNEALVISSSELAKECLLTNDKAVSGRPKSIAVELMVYDYAAFGFGPYDSYWRHMRKLVMLELLSNHRLNLLSHVWRSEVEMMVRKLHELWSTTNKRSSSNNMVVVDLKQWFGDLTMTIIVRIISGKEFMVGSEEGLKFQVAIRDFIKQLGSFPIGDALPFLRWLDLGGQEKTMKRTFQKLDDILEGWLEEHKQKISSLSHDDQTMVDDQKDFMDVMLSVLDDDATKDCNYDADTIIKATCLTMIAGGSDTTMVTLTWAISLLLNNKHTLKKAQDELQEQVGKERQVNELVM